MTYVEFFDKNAVENICACFAYAPQRVILLGGKSTEMNQHAARYEEIFRARGEDVEFIVRSVNRSSLQSILSELSAIVECYEDCVFDLTGGEDLFLVAAGIISERYKERNIQMHRFNITGGTIIDCDEDGNTILDLGSAPELSVVENVRIYGGDVVFDDVKPTGTHLWTFDEEFFADICAMWRICQEDVRLWNAQIGVLEWANKLRDPGADDPLCTVVSVSYLRRELEKNGYEYFLRQDLLGALRQIGVLDYLDDGDLLRIVYKDEQVKLCLTHAGLLLELRITAAATLAQEKGKQEPVYQDVMNGVRIDWDGDIHQDGAAYDIENEIDVLMMRKLTPLFVSCKNGWFDMEELYKLNTVASRFGGRYAKKFLVTTDMNAACDNAEYIRRRAQEMGIVLIEDVHLTTDAELDKLVRSLHSRKEPFCKR